MIRSLVLAALLLSFCAVAGCKESVGGGSVPKAQDAPNKNYETKTPSGGGGAKAAPNPE